jgi:hypothetical protein
VNNFEKIKAMDIDEMARWLGADTCNFCVYQQVNCDDIECKDDIKQWLELEVREGKGRTRSRVRIQENVNDCTARNCPSYRYTPKRKVTDVTSK